MSIIALVAFLGFIVWALVSMLGTTPFSTFSGYIQLTVSYNPTLSQSGGGYTNASPTASNTITNQSKYGSAGAGAAQADLNVSQNYTIGASSSTSIDLTSITDTLQRTAQAFVRIKGVAIELLSLAQDSVTPGTAASSITIDNTVTNALSAQAHTGWFDNAAEGAANGSKFTIPNSGWVAFGVANATGVAVDGTHKIIKVTNNDGALSAVVRVTLFGSAE